MIYGVHWNLISLHTVSKYRCT